MIMRRGSVASKLIIVIIICFILFLFFEHTCKTNYLDVYEVAKRVAYLLMQKRVVYISPFVTPELCTRLECDRPNSFLSNWSIFWKRVFLLKGGEEKGGYPGDVLPEEYSDGSYDLVFDFVGLNYDSLNLVSFSRVYNKAVATFHLRCDNKNYFYTIVLSTTNDKEWLVSDYYTEDDFESMIIEEHKRQAELRSLGKLDEYLDKNIKRQEKELELFISQEDNLLPKFWRAEDDWSDKEKIEQYNRAKTLYDKLYSIEQSIVNQK